MKETLKTNSKYKRHPIHEGIANNQLSGGSLKLINTFIGTPHEIDFTGKMGV